MDLITSDGDIIENVNAVSSYRAIPERQLWIRVLELATEDLKDGKKKTQILKWIDSDGFGYICRAVDINPREASKHLKEIYG